MRLDAQLDAVELHIRADGDRCEPVARPAGVDAVGRNEQAGGNVEIRGRKPELAAAVVAVNDDPFDLGGPAEQARRPLGLSPQEKLADPGRRDALEHGYPPHVEAEASRSVRSPCRSRPKRNVSPAATTSAPMPRRIARRICRLEACQRVVELEHEDVVDSRCVEQLEPPLECREELDVVPNTARGCGSNVTTAVRNPAARAASITRR